MTRDSSRDDDRLVGAVARECVRGHEPLVMLEQVARLVRRHIPYATAGWLLVDPDTMLLNGVYEESVPREAQLALIELEISTADVNHFVDLAAGEVPAAAMSAATDGQLDASRRWREVYGPRGFGDELRAVFRTGMVTWGHSCMTRRAEDPWFTAADVDVMARISGHVAHGIRTGLLLGEAWAQSSGDGPGLVVLDDAGAVESSSPRALHWLGPPKDGQLDSSIVVHEVAAQAKALTKGIGTDAPAVARVQACTGEWLLVRGTRLDGHPARTAVLLEPARRLDVTPLLLHLHQLTPRQQEVTRLLLQGHSTQEIADQLWITPETLRGHIKAIFTKVGVRSRPELLARFAYGDLDPQAPETLDQPVTGSPRPAGTSGPVASRRTAAVDGQQRSDALPDAPTSRRTR